MGGSGWVELIELWIKKPVILSELNKWVLVNRDVGQVGLTPTFHMIKKKKKTYICHLESYATNYLM